MINYLFWNILIFQMNSDVNFFPIMKILYRVKFMIPNVCCEQKLSSLPHLLFSEKTFIKCIWSLLWIIVTFPCNSILWKIVHFLLWKASFQFACFNQVYHSFTLNWFPRILIRIIKMQQIVTKYSMTYRTMMSK